MFHIFSTAFLSFFKQKSKKGFLTTFGTLTVFTKKFKKFECFSKSDHLEKTFTKTDYIITGTCIIFKTHFYIFDFQRWISSTVYYFKETYFFIFLLFATEIRHKAISLRSICITY